MLVRSPALRWRDPSSFLLAAIGTTMGVDGLVMIPQLAFQHGGGAFLIAFVAMVLVLAIPVMILEVGVGVCFQASAPGGLRRLGRRLEWVGWWTTTLAAMLGIVLAGIGAWGVMLAGESLVSISGNYTAIWTTSTADAQRWWNGVLQTNGRPLIPSGGMTLAVVAMWAAAITALSGGLARVGKWCTILVPLAMALLVAIGVAFLYQPGAVNGVARFAMPEWSALLVSDTWLAAARAAFQTQALGLGVYIAYASHLERGGDSSGSAVVVAVAGCGFAILAGLIGAAMTGALAFAEGVPVALRIGDGSLDTMANWSAAIGILPISEWGKGVMTLLFASLWTILAFSTFLGLLSAVAVAITDTFAIGWERFVRHVAPIGGVLSLVSISPHVRDWTDTVRVSWFPIAIAIAIACQCLALVLMSTGTNLQRHINAYSAIKVGWLWRLAIIGWVPASLLILALSVVFHMGIDGIGQHMVNVGAAVLALCAALTMTFLRTRRRTW